MAREPLELISWALLTAATVGSAWCAYQSSLWNGVQTHSLALASMEQFASVRKMSVVNRNLSVDVGTYLSYVEAELHGDAKLAEFLRTHARPELRPALQAWIASEAGARGGEGLNPFSLPEYHLAEQDEVSRLDAQAASNIAAANAANSTGDSYVLRTVLFALALFFFGGTSEARRSGMRRAMLILGSLLFTLTVISVVRLPRAASPPLGRSGRAAPESQ